MISLTLLTLAIDVMTRDCSPNVTIPAVLRVLYSHLTLILFLFGNRNVIWNFLKKVDDSILDCIQVIPAISIVDSNIKPLITMRNNCGSSMRLALKLIKDCKAQGCISSDNTGVLIALVKILLKSIKESIKFPALVTVLPHQKYSKTTILDLGSNMNSDSKIPVQFAITRAVITKKLLALTHLRVALLNVGKEEIKGLKNICNAGSALRKLSGINYIGYLESNDILAGKTDVLVCKGFTGNITLKTIEGILRIFSPIVQCTQKVEKCHFHLKLLEWCFEKYFKKCFNYLNSDHYNGSCLLGLKNIAIKSHGSVNQHLFAVAIEQAEKAVRQKILERISLRLDAFLIKSDKVL